MRQLLGALALGAAAVALAGCGSVTASQVVAAGHSATPGTGLVATGSTAPPTPKQRAEAGAKAILAAFVVPPGARELPAAPGVAGGVLKRVSQQPESPDLVDKAGWWLAPGSPEQVLAWEKKHISHRFDAGESGSTSDGAHTVLLDGYSLPDVYGVLEERVMLVQAVADGTQTAIRVDAQEIWTPARPASEKIPATAKAVTVAEHVGSNPDKVKTHKPVTITDPATVRKLVKLFNSQPLATPEETACPAGFNESLTLTFRAAPGQPALAVADEQNFGCPVLGFTLGGKAQAALSSVSFEQILRTAGLSWKMPGY